MTIDPTLADLSDTLYSVSVAIYSLAIVAFCAQLAFGRRPVAQRELVAAGGAGGEPAPEPPADTGAQGRVRQFGVLGLLLTIAGALTHTGVLVARGLAGDRMPLGNMYEFATAMVLVAVVAFVVLAIRSPQVRHLGLFVLVPVVLAMVAIGLFLYVETGPLIAALRSSWLTVHVSSAVLGSGVFLISGIASVMYLLRVRHDARVASGAADPAGLLGRLPGAAAIDRVAHRTVVFAFPVYTFAMIAGAIWAESAWGRFWGWDPKETWMFISWVVYAGYLHARTTAGWRGRPAAWVNVVGLAVVLFNLTYVNMVSTGLHSYAGVS